MNTHYYSEYALLSLLYLLISVWVTIMHILINAYSQIRISENMHYWEYALLCPRQFMVMTQTESASWSIATSEYTLFLQIHIIIVFLRSLWTLILITEVSHWELKLRKILPPVQDGYHSVIWVCKPHDCLVMKPSWHLLVLPSMQSI